MSYLDFQLLLYVSSEQYEPCRTFYEQVFATQPFYGWDEGPEDRGVKYDLAGTKLVLLTQENPFPTSGAGHLPPGAGSRGRHPGAFLPPLRLAYVPHGGSGGKSHQYLFGANHHRVKRTETVKIKGCSSRPELKREAAYETEPSRKPPPFFRF